MTGGRPPAADDDAGLLADGRGQTLNDLVIGIGLFVIAATFVLAFVPDLVAPFYDPGDRGEKIKAERSVDLLSEHLLQHNDSNASAAVLERSCVEEFFTGSGDASDCPYDSSHSYKKALALDDLSEVRVTLEDPSTGTVVYSAQTDDPSGETPAVWSRIVWMDSARYRLTVYVW